MKMLITYGLLKRGYSLHFLLGKSPLIETYKIHEILYEKYSINFCRLLLIDLVEWLCGYTRTKIAADSWIYVRRVL